MVPETVVASPLPCAGEAGGRTRYIGESVSDGFGHYATGLGLNDSQQCRVLIRLAFPDFSFLSTDTAMTRATALIVLLLISTPVFGQDAASYGDSIGLKFTAIQPGTFRMGSSNGQKDERPVHEVTITNTFEFGTYEVTQSQWFVVMGTTVSEQLAIMREAVGQPNLQSVRGVGDDYPMYLVSWTESQEFISRLSERDAVYDYRLPTEAEWEYAARAGTSTEYSFGDDVDQLSDYAWYIDNAEGGTHPVGTKLPNAWGLYDVHGNVWEWTQDRNGKYSRRKAVDPVGPDKGDGRSMRGGGWGNPARSQRSAHRTGNEEASRSSGGIGIRLVRMSAE